MRKVTAFIIFTSAWLLKERMKIESFNCDLRSKAKAQTQPALCSLVLTQCLCPLPQCATWMSGVWPWPPLQVTQTPKKWPSIVQTRVEISWNLGQAAPNGLSLSVTGRWSWLFLRDIFHTNQWQRGLIACSIFFFWLLLFRGVCCLFGQTVFQFWGCCNFY